MVSLAEGFAEHKAEGLAGDELRKYVGGLMGNASQGQIASAVEGAIGHLGPSGVGNAVKHGPAAAGSHSGLMDTLTHVISGAGGNPGSILSSVGHSSNPGDKQRDHAAKLAEHAAKHHPQELSKEVAKRAKADPHGGLVGSLGDPMLQSIGKQLESRL